MNRLHLAKLSTFGMELLSAQLYSGMFHFTMKFQPLQVRASIHSRLQTAFHLKSTIVNLKRVKIEAKVALFSSFPLATFAMCTIRDIKLIYVYAQIRRVIIV